MATNLTAKVKFPYRKLMANRQLTFKVPICVITELSNVMETQFFEKIMKIIVHYYKSWLKQRGSIIALWKTRSLTPVGTAVATKY